jgi:hypothetical protein
MAYSYNDYADLTVGQSVYPVILDYLDTNDIFVIVTTGASTTTLPTTDFSIEVTSAGTAFTVTLLGTAPALVNELTIVRIGRTTSITAPSRSFSDGSVLKASDLNTQNKQFLLTIQESLDNANTSLPITMDNKFDAGNRVIKNLLTGTADDDSVNLGYVNSLSLYGTSLASIEPQSWSFPTQANGTQLIFLLTSPIPATSIANMFLVEVAGALQEPIADYSIVQTNESYSLVFVTAPASGEKIIVRNFGSTRNALLAPFQSQEPNVVTLPLAEFGGTQAQTADYIRITDKTTAEVFTVDVSGAITIGSDSSGQAGFTELSSSGLKLGYIDPTASGNTGYGVALTKVTGLGKLEIQGNNSVSGGGQQADQTAIDVSYGQSSGTLDSPFQVKYDGTVVTTAGVLSTGPLTGSDVTATGTVSGLHGRIVGTNSSLEVGDTLSSGSRVKITHNKVSNAQFIKLRGAYFHNTSQPGGLNVLTSDLVDNTTGLPTTTGSGGIGWWNDGSMRIGKGGTGVLDGSISSNGSAGPTGYGGIGGLAFQHGISGEYGPHLRFENDAITMVGKRVPVDQGGSTGELGTTGATIRYGDLAVRDRLWANVEDTDLVCKKQVAQGQHPGHVLFHPIVNQTYTGQTDLIIYPQSTDHNFDPDGGFGWNTSAGWYSVSKGVWKLAVRIPCQQATWVRIYVQHIIAASPPTAFTTANGNGTTTWANLSGGSGYASGFSSGSAVGSFPVESHCVVGLWDPTVTGQSLPTTPLNNGGLKIRILLKSSYSFNTDYPSVEFTRVQT